MLLYNSHYQKPHAYEFQACQKISEWQNGTSKHSDEVVEHHFKTHNMDVESIHSYVKYEAGDGVPCMSLETAWDPKANDYVCEFTSLVCMTDS